MAASRPPTVLRFEPILRRYLWGGRRLGERLGKSIGPEADYAESWELVDRPEAQSIVAEGPWRGRSLHELIEAFGGQLLGPSHESARPGSAADGWRSARFPLLLKYLDAERVLSVQVHPADEYAQRMDPPDLGKTEAWYVIEARPGACIYAGLREGIGPEQLRGAITSGQVESVLHRIDPKVGDCLYIPAGTVHALGAGLVIAEIQQASDTTFRLHDWNRLDAAGRQRPLHLDQAMAVIDFDRGPVAPVVAQATESIGRERLVASRYFLFDRLRPVDSRSTTTIVGGDGAFEVLTCTAGEAEIEDGTRLAIGQTILLTAAAPPQRIRLGPSTELLSCRPPR